MKTLLISAALLIVSGAVYGQTKPVKPPYQKVVVLQPIDPQILVQIATAYRNVLIYNPSLTANDKIKQQQDLDAYLAGLNSRTRIDSVKLGGKK